MEERYEYWIKKVEKVAKISKEYGYSSFDIGFWREQPAGVISLIIDVHKAKEKEV